MLNKIKQKIEAFLESDKDAPVLTGFISGLYPFLFYYSNNYPSKNSWLHFLTIAGIYIAIPVVLTVFLYFIFTKVKKINSYRKNLLFVLLIFFTSVFMSQAIYLTLKKKILLAILVVACVLSFKLYNYYKKIIFIIVIVMLIPLFKFAVHIYEDAKPTKWTKLEDNIADVKFKHRPNVYMIQPDGYVSRQVIESPPYNYKTDFYDWLSENNFKVYDDFRSNYPASLTSNASMFAMKHHYFDDLLFPALEMPNSREVIMKNSVVEIFNNNQYETFYLGQDEYFQQNLVKGNYKHYNLETKNIPLFAHGGSVVRDVYTDLSNFIDTSPNKNKFFFIERVLPHHVLFYGKGDRKTEGRKEYLTNLEKANIWLKETLKLINEKDKNAIIIILADHGGWVGLGSMNELFSTKDNSLIKSTFGNMAAIQWNGIDHAHYDSKLKSNVNVFRVLFACLSENKSYLDYLEKDESYNIRPGNFITESVHKLIDENGTIVNEKH